MKPKTISHQPSQIHTEIHDAWTMERRKQAIPKPLPEVPAALPEGSGQKPWVDQTPVATQANITAKDRLKAENFTRVELAVPVDTPTESPYRCNGKLFFSWKGKDYVGSAGSIYLDVLLTAAHNVYDEGEWSDEFIYYPAYPDCDKSWSWSRAAIFTAWKNNTDYAYDYAMIQTNNPMENVGSMSCILNLSPVDRTWVAYGYPAVSPYPGNQMYQTAGNYVAGGSIITMDNNDMTQGSSGGNWITQHQGRSYVNGVQSTRGAKATYANSPYLGRIDFDALVNCVTTGNCE